MMRICRRFMVGAAFVLALVLAPMAVVTVVSPGISKADCAYGTVWDPGSNACVVPGPPPPPPPPPGPVSMCIGAPIPFVPMSWCFPVGG